VACSTHQLQPAAQLANVPRLEGFPIHSQISANGRTTSLGDHDTQEAAAAAFDRAAINKDGAAAKTNFDRDNYAAEMTVLASADATVSDHLCCTALWCSVLNSLAAWALPGPPQQETLWCRAWCAQHSRACGSQGTC
jgi:hypothetical protein